VAKLNDSLAMTMAEKKLKKKQQELVEEIDEIASLLVIDYQNISRVKKSERTIHLEIIKDQMIRGQIIMYYTLVDDVLGDQIRRYYFGKKSDSIRFRETKRFRLFNHHIIEELSLLKKFNFVRGIMAVPKSITDEIERLNALRNGIAHALFPQHSKRYRPLWKGKNIFTFDGIKSMVEDMEKVFEFFK
jgi:hypothetical protein